MKEAPFSLDLDDNNDDSLVLKDMLFKYLRYWPWFLAAMVLCLGLGYVYMRFAPVTYWSVAKIKIIDESKELNVASEALAFMGNGSINLENEIEVLKSYRLLTQVVSDLKLDIEVFKAGGLFPTRVYDPPFIITKQPELDSLSNKLTYSVVVNGSNFLIADEKGQQFSALLNQPEGESIGLPFGIQLQDTTYIEAYQGMNYTVVINPIKETVQGLSNKLKVEATNKNSDILSLALEGENKDRSEAILNTIIRNFDQDGILDRQLVSKRTLEVIDKRFVYLSGELDSIEIGKQDFKQANKLSYIEADAGQTLQRKSDTEDEVFQLESQISLSQMLKRTVVGQAEYSLLPADIGLENTGLNALVYDYNQMALERDKLLTSVGSNHPKLQELSGQMERGKVNILKTLNVYQAQLKTSLKKLNQERNLAGALFSQLPEKEKMLRSIERQQSIKENLFLLLLQKREEAAINLAATAPSIKVIDYGLTANGSISPKKLIVYPLSLMLGLFVPFLILYIRFTLDTKIHDRSDLEKLNTGIPIIAEIPFLKGNKSFKGTNDRSILAESFRIGCTNVNYLLPKKERGQGQVIFVTSAIKGEGKTLVAYNLSLAYASLKKRVLLIGADLRNPALNEHFDSKKTKGLSDYLNDPTMNWKYCINDGYSKNEYHKVCFSGAIPPNAAELLSGSGFGEFMDLVKKEFDYIIVDTAPTLLVTDTLLISQYADLTLFVARAGFTDKRLIEFSKDLNSSKKLYNMAYVLNEVGHGKTRDYNYGHGYGYGSTA